MDESKIDNQNIPVEEDITNMTAEHDKTVESSGSKVKITANIVAKGITTGAESMSTMIRKALSAREHVIMVRVNEDSLTSINQLKDAGLFRSRSEAAAYLIAEGIAAKDDLFKRIIDKIEKINILKNELRTLAGED